MPFPAFDDVNPLDGTADGYGAAASRDLCASSRRKHAREEQGNHAFVEVSHSVSVCLTAAKVGTGSV